jgi:putative ABC transport system permease protein
MRREQRKMFGKILKKDIVRNKIITSILLSFIMLSSLLIASASSIIGDLVGSMNKLFEKSSAPHFVQMHAGEINQKSIDAFTSTNPLVKAQQTVEMINISGSNVFLRNKQQSENESIMDISFVKQNTSFDFLLNLQNEIIHVVQGEVGVPIYYMQQHNLKIGDKIWITNGDFNMEFTITTFIRDAQMNPSIVSSKRFVISDTDWKKVKSNLGESEYLIEFQLNELKKMSEFESMYQSSNLPQKGPAITYALFQTMNALTDGIIAVVIIFISLLLITIAILCIRFMMIATIEEDYREIGVMKAIGIPTKNIQKLYLTKYIVLAAIASICGYILSLFVGQLFTANIALYMGTAEKTVLHSVVPFLSIIIVFSMVVLYCRFTLRKIRRITTIEALRIGHSPTNQRNRQIFLLHKSSFSNVNVFLGIRDVIRRFKVYGLLCFVYIICTFIIIVPINFLNTVKSPEFIRYMGAGKSDIRIDLQQSNDVEQRFNDMLSYIQKDKDITKHAALVTSTFNVLNNDGAYDKIHVEIGDFTTFPLQYIKGTAPQRTNEIALSYMNAKELEKNIGDTLVLLVNGQQRELTICGIYQDITNGGKTAKALLPYDSKNILWYVMSLNVKSRVHIDKKIEEYKKTFYPAKVTNMKDYLSQTLGATINQLQLVTVLAIVISLSLAVLITAMFLKMILAKDISQITIMKNLGFSHKNIRVQYITRSLFVLFIGTVLGTIISSTLGQSLVSVLGSFMGASHITFVVNPLFAYILCPLSLLVVVTITTLISSTTIKKTNTIKE